MQPTQKISKVVKNKKNIFKDKYFIVLLITILIAPLSLFFYRFYQKEIASQVSNTQLTLENQKLTYDIIQMNETIKNINTEIEKLQNEDLRKTNQNVKAEIEKLKTSFKSAVTAYEGILNLEDRGSNITSEESKFSSILNFLLKDDLASAQKTITDLTTEINKEKTRLAALAVPAIPASVPEIKEAPSSGYRRQKVTVEGKSFLVDIVSADLNSTRVIVDTASDSTCGNNCPVLPLATYVSRSGAYAGVNGTYFCPETYPSCADKKNSFDTLVMNKNKTYFNSDNNVYSTVPVAVFSGNSGRFIGQSQNWDRDTGVDAVIANRPLLVLDGNLMFSSGGEEKEVSRGNRSFLGASGNIGYIGVVHNASVVEAAKILQTMGVKSAINLDDGGSTALWSGGYKAGPGRNLPNAVLFVRK
jgi:cell division protein FtsL